MTDVEATTSGKAEGGTHAESSHVPDKNIVTAHS